MEMVLEMIHIIVTLVHWIKFLGICIGVSVLFCTALAFIMLAYGEFKHLRRQATYKHQKPRQPRRRSNSISTQELQTFNEMTSLMANNLDLNSLDVMEQARYEHHCRLRDGMITGSYNTIHTTDIFRGEKGMYDGLR